MRILAQPDQAGGAGEHRAGRGRRRCRQVRGNRESGAQTTTVTKLQKFLWVFSPYRPDIQQGNFVSQEMLNQLKVGQTRDQVKFVLGTPLLTDVFHADRWDYPFYLARGNGELTTSRVTVYFKDDKVDRIDGGNLPTEREYINRLIGISKYADRSRPEQDIAGRLQAQARRARRTRRRTNRMTQLKIAVAGASGRMGRMLIEAIAAAPDAVLAGALDREGSPFIGQRRGRVLRPADRRRDPVRPRQGPGRTPTS